MPLRILRDGLSRRPDLPGSIRRCIRVGAPDMGAQVEQESWSGDTSSSTSCARNWLRSGPGCQWSADSTLSGLTNPTHPACSANSFAIGVPSLAGPPERDSKTGAETMSRISNWGISCDRKRPPCRVGPNPKEVPGFPSARHNAPYLSDTCRCRRFQTENDVCSHVTRLMVSI